MINIVIIIQGKTDKMVLKLRFSAIFAVKMELDRNLLIR